MASKKRERLEIIRDILQVTRENRQIKPTRLLYASNLSPQMFKGYVEELLKKKFLILKEIGKGKKEFSIAEKGHDFLREYKRIQEFIENFGL